MSRQKLTRVELVHSPTYNQEARSAEQKSKQSVSGSPWRSQTPGESGELVRKRFRRRFDGCERSPRACLRGVWWRVHHYLLRWLWAAEGVRPDRWDATGADIGLTGATVILLAVKLTIDRRATTGVSSIVVLLVVVV